jgi:hypothetical protein
MIGRMRMKNKIVVIPDSIIKIGEYSIETKGSVGFVRITPIKYIKYFIYKLLSPTRKIRIKFNE